MTRKKNYLVPFQLFPNSLPSCISIHTQQEYDCEFSFLILPLPPYLPASSVTRHPNRHQRGRHLTSTMQPGAKKPTKQAKHQAALQTVYLPRHLLQHSSTCAFIHAFGLSARLAVDSATARHVVAESVKYEVRHP